jgi:DNA invertase Pin-like site-specific DNA recombinase
MAIIAYLRVSTDEQVQSGLGLDAQLSAMEKAFGKLDAVFRDEGYSGGNANRPGLRDALEALGDGDELVVAKRDRLSRDMFLSLWLEKEVKRRGAKIRSAAGEGDDPTAVLMKRIVDSFAEYERGMIGLRTRAALAQKRARGERCGGQVPYGYRAHPDGLHLVPDGDEQEVSALIRTLREEGQSLRSVAAELEQRGVSTKQGKQTWHPQTIKQILSQKVDLEAVLRAA